MIRSSLNWLRSMFWSFQCGQNKPQDGLASWGNVTDADFLADAHKLKVDVDPVSGEQLRMIVEELLNTPQGLAQRARPSCSSEQRRRGHCRGRRESAAGAGAAFAGARGVR